MIVSGLQIKQNRKSATMTQHVKMVDAWMKRTNDHSIAQN